MRLGTMCIALAILAGSPALAHAGRYELVPEPDVRQSSTNRVASAYVIDKKANQFWICTARYNFQDLTANKGDCVQLPSDIGRPSLTETSDMRAVTGSAAISAFLPVFWFIEPTSGEVQFCATRHRRVSSPCTPVGLLQHGLGLGPHFGRLRGEDVGHRTRLEADSDRRFPRSAPSASPPWHA
jgi:hypothetical protein